VMDNTRLRKSKQPDVVVEGGRSLYVFRILTEPARTWVEDYVSREGFQPQFPNVLYVEHRYVRDLAAGMQAEGLVVQRCK
jgi:hypothetical protein